MNQKQFTIIVYADPSHAWGKVKRSVLQSLNIEQHISPYSYQRGDYAYLEEDCDLNILCQRLNEHGTKVKFIEKTTNNLSRIRSYESFHVSNPDTTS